MYISLLRWKTYKQIACQKTFADLLSGLSMRLVQNNPTVTKYRDHRLDVVLCHADVRMKQGQTALARNLIDEAMLMAREALRLHPTDPDRFVDLAEICIGSSRIARETGRLDL